MAAEASLQRAAIRISRKSGWRAFKWVSPGRRGVPDYIFFNGPPLRIVFVEFKAPGEAPTPIQRFVHALLRRLGAQVEVISDIEHARRVFS